jgi:hypothetical protein
MALESRIYDDGEFAVTRISGVVTAEEIINFQFWLISENKNGNLKNDYRLLIDARNVKTIQADEKDIHRLSQINTVYGRERGKLRTGIAVDTGPGKQLAQLHQSLSKTNGIEVQIFETRHAACIWLDIDPMLDVVGYDHAEQKQVGS